MWMGVSVKLYDRRPLPFPKIVARRNGLRRYAMTGDDWRGCCRNVLF